MRIDNWVSFWKENLGLEHQRHPSVVDINFRGEILEGIVFVVESDK